MESTSMKAVSPSKLTDAAVEVVFTVDNLANKVLNRC